MQKILPFVLIACGALSIQSAAASTTTNLINDNTFTVGRGDIETNFSFDTQILRGDAKAENVMFNLGGNYFVTDMFAPGVDLKVEHNGAGTSSRLFPNLKAYWPLYSKILPYAQVGFGYAHVPGDDGVDFGFGVGVNYLLTSSVAIGAKLSYEILAGTGIVHQISLPIGFAIYFKI